MPRTGGVFSLLSGSKGSPNTTIQSSPYNSQLDDFAQDANLARPVTAGGTGATTAGGARTNLGLVPGTDVQAFDAGLLSIAGLTTAANQMIYTTALDVYATTALTPFARTILDDADAATVKATLGLATVATSASAGDLTSGTIADARLPSVMTSKEIANLLIRTGVAGTNGYLQNVAGDSTHSGYNAFHLKDNTRAGYLGYADSASKTINIVAENTYKYNFSGAVPTIDNVPIWYGGNDGSGSGLDADLLDGYHATTLPVSTPVQTALNGKQNSLGYTPVQQGGGTNQGANKVYIGWLAGSQIGLQVDASNFGNIWPHSIDGGSTGIFQSGNTGMTKMIFNWSGQPGQPSWVWGGADGQNMYVYNPSNFSVTNSAQLGGLPASSYAIAAQTPKLPFTSAQQTITNGGQLVIAHGLGVTPGFASTQLVCVTAEAGYSAGDIVSYPAIGIGFNTSSYGATPTVDVTNVTLRISSAGFAIFNKSNGVPTGLTSANWRLIVKAYP